MPVGKSNSARGNVSESEVVQEMKALLPKWIELSMKTKKHLTRR